MSRVALLIPILSVIMCCSSQQSFKNETEPDTVMVDAAKKKLSMKDGNLDTISAQLLFSVPVKDFFEGDAEMLNRFERKEQSELGLYVPLSLYVDDKSVFIPNRASKKILEFDKRGKMLNKYNIPVDSISPDYLGISPVKNLVVSGWNKKMAELSGDRLLNTFDNQDLFFSLSENNILFRRKGGFYDKLGYFGGEYKFSYLYSSFDYKLFSDSEFILAYADDESSTLRFKIVEAHGVLRRETDLGDNVDIKYYLGFKILSYRNSKVKFVASTDEPREGFVLVSFDFDDKRMNKVLLVNKRVGEEVFIGEGAVLWPNGVAVYYDDNENILYSLYTTGQAIEVAYYELNF